MKSTVEEIYRTLLEHQKTSIMYLKEQAEEPKEYMELMCLKFGVHLEMIANIYETCPIDEVKKVLMIYIKKYIEAVENNKE